MGASKSDHFTREQNELAAIAKALGHPARIAIVQHLLKVGSCVCGGIVDELPLAQPTVSQHLKELKIAGIIKGEIDGNAVCYCIDEITWNRNKELLGAMFNSYQPINKCC